MALASASVQSSDPVTLDVAQAVVLSIAVLLELEPCKNSLALPHGIDEACHNVEDNEDPPRKNESDVNLLWSECQRKQSFDDELKTDDVFDTFDCFASRKNSVVFDTFDCFEFMAKCHEFEMPLKAERSQKTEMLDCAPPALQSCSKGWESTKQGAGLLAPPGLIPSPFVVQNTFLQLRTEVSESEESPGARRRASTDFMLFRPVPDVEEEISENVTAGLQSLEGAALQSRSEGVESAVDVEVCSGCVAEVPNPQPAPPQQQNAEACPLAPPGLICSPFVVRNTFLQLRTALPADVGPRPRASTDSKLLSPERGVEEESYVTEGLQSLEGAAAALWLRSQERTKCKRTPWADVPILKPEKHESTGEAGVDSKKSPKKKPARAPKAPRTTTVLRNLPAGCTRASLLMILDAHGLRGMYDFVYLPFDFDTGEMFGYAFVNWISHEVALRVWQQLPIFEFSWSDPYQGLDAHLKRYTNSSVMHGSVPDERKPILFSAGERISFPKPTRRIKAPRARPPPREIKRDRHGRSATV